MEPSATTKNLGRGSTLVCGWPGPNGPNVSRVSNVSNVFRAERWEGEAEQNRVLDELKPKQVTVTVNITATITITITTTRISGGE
ncbi:hypothetical protein N9H91_01400 [Pseudomonadales bacterium]|nr:hypothetical protein [Pseudomonadales bacterium]